MATLHALHQQLRPLQHIIVVDNDSNDATRSLLAQWRTQDTEHRRVIERADKNLGIAQNEGIKAAQALGAQWVLLMDHDSLADPQMLAVMEHGLLQHPRPETLGIIAPNLLDIHSKREARYPVMLGKYKVARLGFTPELVRLEQVLGVIASGSLVSMRALDAVGLMREDFVIDYIDKEFCLRLVRAGYAIIALRDAVLRHELGKAKDHMVLGRWRVTTTNHSAARVYTIFRNRVRCWYAYGHAVPAFMIYDVLAMCYDALRIGLFEEDTAAKLRAAWHGLCDARREYVA